MLVIQGHFLICVAKCIWPVGFCYIYLVSIYTLPVSEDLCVILKTVQQGAL